MVIWGTDVSVQTAKKKLRDFLENFVDDLPEEGEENPYDATTRYYMARLEEVRWTPAVQLDVQPSYQME